MYKTNKASIAPVLAFILKYYCLIYVYAYLVDAVYIYFNFITLFPIFFSHFLFTCMQCVHCFCQFLHIERSGGNGSMLTFFQLNKIIHLANGDVWCMDTWKAK